MRLVVAFLLYSLMFTGISQAQTDSLHLRSMNRFQRTVDKTTSSRAYQMAYIGVPLIIGGLIVKGEDDHFSSLRNDYMPGFKHHYDDYFQYLPAVTMLAMKLGGVEGRSSWRRMIASDAFSAVIMAATINSLKTATKVTRPDGSNNHSFPSGHTATAFMAATMMSKEYGGRSPWYSVGAYSVATATGLTRMMNNKHWLSDVMVGAGIGIISTELGYFLADLIFKDKGINRSATVETFDRMHNPSFFGVYLGLNMLPGNYKLPDHSSLNFSTGSNAGIEGAWFMSPYVGIGGRFTISSMPITLDNEAQTEPFDLVSGYAGVYFSYPISTRWMAGSKILTGYSFSPKYELSTITIKKKGAISAGTGCSLTFRAKETLGVKFFLDYTITPSPMPLEEKYLQILTLGSTMSIAF